MFPGTTTEDMESYITPTLKRNPGKIAKEIIRVAIQAKKTVNTVAVSSILARGNSDPLERKRVQVK